MAESNNLGPTGTGTVVADVGGDRGALILYTPESLLGAEIEISPARGGPRTHVAVRERSTGQGRLFAAFYPSLGAGEYIVWTSRSTPAGTTRISGGEVTEVSIRMSAHPDASPAFTVSTQWESLHQERPVGHAAR
jgi:hypothetical protein